MIGLGTQDNFELATNFLESGGLETPTMLWDPTFATWQAFGIQANSQMMVISPDLTQGSNLIYGFDENQRTSILELVSGI